MGWGQRALEFVPNPIKDLIVRGVNLVAGAGAEVIKDNSGEGTGKKKETKKERVARIKQEEPEQDAWAEADLPSTDSDDWDTQEL